MQLTRSFSGFGRGANFGVFVKSFIAMFSTLLMYFPSTTLFAEADPVDPYRSTQVTEKEDKDIKGEVTRREVTKVSRINLKETIQEVHVTNDVGVERLVSRTTTTMNMTLGKSVTVTESLPNPSSTDLVVTSITTTTKDDSGGRTTITETRNPLGTMVISNRVTAKHANGNWTTTVESMNTEGKLVETQRTAFTYPPESVEWMLPN